MSMPEPLTTERVRSAATGFYPENGAKFDLWLAQFEAELRARIAADLIFEFHMDTVLGRAVVEFVRTGNALTKEDR